MSGGFESIKSRKRREVATGHSVFPQAVNGKSYVESVMGFFQDLSSAYSNPPCKEEKEIIIWAKLIDMSKPFTDFMCSENILANEDKVEDILLMLGYKNGLQIWKLMDNGTMTEILSMRQGPVKSACILPPPSSQSDMNFDPHNHDRPLLALSLAADRKQLFTSVNIISLVTGKHVDTLEFKSNINEISLGGEGTFIITLQDQIFIHSSYDLSCLSIIRDCHTCPNGSKNAIAIGLQWLAYSPSKSLVNLQSAGGMHRDHTQSYTASVISAAKTVSKGIATFSDTVNWLAAKSNITIGEDNSQSTHRSISPRQQHNLPIVKNTTLTKPENHNGLITILNLSKLYHHPKSKTKNALPAHSNGIPPSEAIVSHFVAYDKHPVVCMEFSANGMMLATADKTGHAFNVFVIYPHPLGVKYAAVQHIYTLYRGDTSARVQEIVFSSDSRWLTVSTHRGTSHLFPIAVYGGVASVRTHVSHRVVNRSSRFHKSAGLEDMENSSFVSTHHNSTSNLSSIYSTNHKHHQWRNHRVPPFNPPTVVHPLYQIHSGGILLNQSTLTNLTLSSTQQVAKHERPSSAGWQGDMVVSSLFLQTHLEVTRSANNHDVTSTRVPHRMSSVGEQCMLLMTSDGVLTEYHLGPRAQQGLNKVTDDSPIELVATAKYRWPLQRLLSWNEVAPPLSPQDRLLKDESNRKNMVREIITKLANVNAQPATRIILGRASSTAAEIENTRELPIAAKKYNSESDLYSAKTRQPSTQQKFPKHSNSRGHSQHPGFAVQRKNITVTSPNLHDTTNAETNTNGFERFNGYGEKSTTDDNHFDDKNRQGKMHGDEWLAQVEIVTHEGPARRLWMGPQFSFKTRQSTGSTMHVSSASSALLSDRSTPTTGRRKYSSCSSDEILPSANHDVYVDELDLHSLKIQTARSDPVPTPNTTEEYEGFHNSCYSSITIEAGSGSFDRHGHMLEIGAYGSLEDRRYASSDSEERLRERLLDAMQEEVNSGHRTFHKKSGSLSSVEFAPVDEDLNTAHFEFDSENASLEMTTES